MSGTVTLTHPDSRDPIEVTARRARIMRRQGWQDHTPAATSSTTAAGPAQGATPTTSLED